MGGQVADAVAPFCRRLGAGGAVPARTELSLAAASTALFHDLLANPAFVSTSLGRHKGTFYSGFNTGASHWNHPLSYWIRKLVKKIAGYAVIRLLKYLIHKIISM
jgi:hypothetical protein